MVKKRTKFHPPHGFSEFMTDPVIAGGLLVFALIALFLSILEFSAVLTY